MPRVCYIPPGDFEPLPEWMDDSRAWKSRKVGGGRGESERLMKKGREEKTRGSRYRNERMRRFEESIKRKERMVKDDRKRSTLADGHENTRMNVRKAGKNGPKVEKKDNMIRDAGKRWQLGDGLQMALQKDSVKTENGKLGRKNLSRRHRDSRKERVVVQVQRVKGREKVKQWIDKFQTATTSVQEVSSEASSEDPIKITDRNTDLFDIVSPWPISRYCMEDPDFKLKVPDHCYTSNPSDVHDMQPVNILYCLFGRPASDTGAIYVHSDEGNATGMKFQKSGSPRKRFSSILRRFAGFFFRAL